MVLNLLNKVFTHFIKKHVSYNLFRKTYENQPYQPWPWTLRPQKPETACLWQQTRLLIRDKLHFQCAAKLFLWQHNRGSLFSV